MESGVLKKTGSLNREYAPEALHQLLFAWGKRLWGSPGAASIHKEGDASLTFDGKSRIAPMVMADVSLANWQQQALTQLTHALMLALSKKGRDADACYVMHVQATQHAGEISITECLERLERLCAEEMADLPVDVRAKLASIRAAIH